MQAKAINSARPFVLLKNGVPVARLVPDNEQVCTGRDLAEALARTELTSEDAKAWRRDLQAARRTLKAPAWRPCLYAG